jgi:hypothetical protein
MPEPWSYTKTVLGHLPSMKNRRKAVEYQKADGTMRKAFIKSDDALDYVRGFLLQVRRPATPYLGTVMLEADIYYRNPACDLDESLLMDCLQVGTGNNRGAGIIGNDNQIKAKLIRWHLDKIKPRLTFKLTAYEPQD